MGFSVGRNAIRDYSGTELDMRYCWMRRAIRMRSLQTHGLWVERKVTFVV
jgi:hypothetical protein